MDRHLLTDIRIIKYDLTFKEAMFNDIALTFWLAGCSKKPKCEGCHSPFLWDFNNGEYFSNEKIELLIYSNRIIDAVVFLGDEYDFSNIRKKEGVKYYLFSGRNFDEINQKHKDYFDYIKHGSFKIDQLSKDSILSSTNQRVWIKETNEHVFI